MFLVRRLALFSDSENMNKLALLYYSLEFFLSRLLHASDPLQRLRFFGRTDGRRAFSRMTE